MFEKGEIMTDYNGNQGATMQQNAPQQQSRTNIWYRPVTQADYEQIAELGEVCITLRILPGFKDQQIYESVVEKDVSRSRFPNSQKWMAPVLVINDPLHPEKNGFVGVYEMSKTVHKALRKNTPPNYFDLNQGYNFNIVARLVQSKDGTQWFPNYEKSGFDQAPTQIDAKYVYDKLTEYKIADFAAFANRINNPRTDNNYQGQAPQQNYVQQQAVSGQSTYSPGAATQPVQNNFAPQQQAAPVQQPVPQNNAAPSAPAQSAMPWQADNNAPPAPQAPEAGSDDFESIFGG
jgi:hypothetical protein